MTCSTGVSSRCLFNTFSLFPLKCVYVYWTVFICIELCWYLLNFVFIHTCIHTHRHSKYAHKYVYTPMHAILYTHTHTELRCSKPNLVKFLRLELSLCRLFQVLGDWGGWESVTAFCFYLHVVMIENMWKTGVQWGPLIFDFFFKWKYKSWEMPLHNTSFTPSEN